LRAETFSAIDAEAADRDEGEASKKLYDELRARRDHVSGTTALPDRDPHLDETVRTLARQRSQEISAAHSAASSASSVLGDEGRPIPVWLWLAWALALIGGGVAVFQLW
jgi:hypothetical protein